MQCSGIQTKVILRYTPFPQYSSPLFEGHWTTHFHEWLTPIPKEKNGLASPVPAGLPAVWSGHVLSVLLGVLQGFFLMLRLGLLVRSMTCSAMAGWMVLYRWKFLSEIEIKSMWLIWFSHDMCFFSRSMSTSNPPIHPADVFFSDSRVCIQEQPWLVWKFHEVPNSLSEC